jgi:hypothetical protein
MPAELLPVVWGGSLALSVLLVIFGYRVIAETRLIRDETACGGLWRRRDLGRCNVLRGEPGCGQLLFEQCAFFPSTLGQASLELEQPCKDRHHSFDCNADLKVPLGFRLLLLSASLLLLGGEAFIASERR